MLDRRTENLILVRSKFIEQKEYWLKKLRGIGETSFLIKENPGNSEKEIITQELMFPTDLSSKLIHLGNNNDLAIYMIILAGLMSLLYRYTGNRDISIGSPVYTHRETKETINDMVLIRQIIGNNFSFKDVLQEIHRSVLEAYENQDYPINRLFEFLFDLQRDEKNIPNVTDVVCVLKNIHNETNVELIKWNLFFCFERKGENIIGEIHFNSNLFSKPMVKKISMHLIEILKNAVEKIDTSIEKISYLTLQEKEQLVYVFNDTSFKFPKDKTIFNLFEEKSLEVPQQIALIYSNHQITYDELNRRANQLAMELSNKGVKQNDIVAVMVEISLEMVIGILGILKSSAAYLPIDPNFPMERILYVLKDSAVDLLLSDSTSPIQNQEIVETLNISKQWIYSNKLSLPQRISGGENIVYVIYTSGSTGHPKGVIIEHYNITNQLMGLTDSYHFDNHLSHILMAPITFDPSVQQIFLPLITGGKLYLIPKKLKTDVVELTDFLMSRKINVFNTVPSVMKMVADYCSEWKRLSINFIILAGELFSMELYKQLIRDFDINTLINIYGPTEATINSTLYECELNRNYNAIPIGSPLKNYKIWILDFNGNLLPVGIRGEICISGEGIGRGYLNLPELTSEKFIPFCLNPLFVNSGNPNLIGSKMYRTGDLGRWLEDGNIEFLGRFDNQVKIRGSRIELDEIEKQLSNHPNVKDVVVLPFGNNDTNTYLAAFVVFEKPGIENELSEFLKDKCPDYMIPSHFLEITHIPLTSNGKIDRKALESIEKNKGNSYTAPRNDIERQLLIIWSSILGTEKELIDIDDNFFELGGHSLKVTTLIAQIHKQFEVNIPPQKIFTSPTIREIARIIIEAEKSTFDTIEPTEKKEYYKLSSAQERMYFLQEMEKERSTYNILNIVQLYGVLDINRLEKAFEGLIKRHESLSASFRLVSDKPVQHYHQDVILPIDYIEAERNDTEKIINNFVKPFDLSTAPLIRVTLVKVDELEYVLMIDMHHIISDGISLTILIRDWLMLYEENVLPNLKIQYKDFSEWQSQQSNALILKQQEEFWLNQLYLEIPVLNLPIDFTRPSMQSFNGKTQRFDLEEDIVEGLKSLAFERDVTLNVLLLAIINVLLYKLTLQDDILVGMPVAGRRHSDMNEIVGIFVNTLCMRNFPQKGKIFTDFLNEVKEHVINALKNQDYPFEELVEKISLKRDISRNPLFDVMFSMQNSEFRPLENSDLQVLPYNYDSQTAKFDMTFIATETGKDIHFLVEYCSELFKDETISKIIEYFNNIIIEVLINPTKEISELIIISEVEKKQLLHEFNETAGEYPHGKLTQQLFMEQVAGGKDRIAVIGPTIRSKERFEQSISYQVLAMSSNHYAKRLREIGVSHRTVVAVMISHSIEMIIAVLGILKAGGAYLPIDVTYPSQRVESIVSDSRCQFFLGDYTKKNDNGNVKVLSIDDLSLYGMTNDEPVNLNIVEDLAYIIYTSGSTGNPKGIMVGHRSLVNYLKWAEEKYIQGITCNFPLYSSLSFDLTVTSFYLPLLSGNKIVIYAQNDNEFIISRIIREAKVDIIKLTPTHLLVLKDQEVKNSSIKKIILGGENLTTAVANMAFKKFGNSIEIYNEYGPTESTVGCMIYKYNPSKDNRMSVPIGVPIKNNRIYILNKYQEPVPMIVVGELYISGLGIAKGYLNQPELTSEKFIIVAKRTDKLKPLLSQISNSHSIFYRTGDLARWLPNGIVEYIGREDEQIKIRGNRIELGEIEFHLQKHPKVRDVVVVVKQNNESEIDYLCAYIVSDEDLDAEVLRELLIERVPSYMIPNYFIFIEKIPLTLSGKVNRNNLPAPEPIINTKYEIPQNEIEETLTIIWQDVLALKKIGVNDNFFQVGGDSIKGIQVTSRLRKYNYSMQMKDLFLFPTIKQLARKIEKITQKTDQSIIEGEVLLSPIQNWFFESYANETNFDFSLLNHFNQSVTIFKREGFDSGIVFNVFKEIVKHHDALRMTFTLKDGEVNAWNRNLNNELVSLKIVELKEIDDIHLIQKTIEEEAKVIQQSMNISDGPLVRLGLFRTNQGDHLVIVIHHMVVDGVSWRILLEDFTIGYQQGTENHSIQFQEKTDSFQRWANKLKEYSNTQEILSEIPYWKSVTEKKQSDFPTDYNCKTLEESQKTRIHYDTVSVTLDHEETEKLITKVNEAYNTEINDILLAALGLATKEMFGRDWLLLDLEGHGRSEIFKEISISRTIGWFTSLFPVRLDITHNDNLSHFIKQVKETLRNIPRKGLGYGILRYLSDKKIEEINVASPISFNYLGQLDQQSSIKQKLFEYSGFKSGEDINPNLNIIYLLDINGMILSGKLHLTFGYNRCMYRRQTIEQLSQVYCNYMKKIITHCIGKSNSELTPSDLDYRKLSIEELSELENVYALKDLAIKNIYKLSPLQAGMFYYYLVNKDTSLYFEQYEISVEGELNLNLLENSFNVLLERYDVLRTVFLHEGVGEPLQVVLRKRIAGIKYKDLSDLPKEEIVGFIEAFKTQERKKGFDLDIELLTRLSLFKIANNRFSLIWSFHHIIMDGWCIGVIFKDLIRIYISLLEKKQIELENVTHYNVFIQWLEEQDQKKALTFWRNYLEGYNNTVELPKKLHSNDSIYKKEEYSLRINEEISQLLTNLAKDYRITINTVVQTLWGILLQKLNGTDDVVFATVVSGRPPELEDIENMVGLFINTVPVRINWGEENEGFSQLLGKIQKQLLEMRPFEYIQLAEILACNPLKSKLINHILIFETYLGQQEMQMFGGPESTGLKIFDLKASEQLNYDFNIFVSPGRAIEILFSYNSNVYGNELIRSIASYFIEIVKQIAYNPSICREEIKFIKTESPQNEISQHNSRNIIEGDQGDFDFE